MGAASLWLSSALNDSLGPSEVMEATDTDKASPLNGEVFRFGFLALLAPPLEDFFGLGVLAV